MKDKACTVLPKPISSASIPPHSNFIQVIQPLITGHLVRTQYMFQMFRWFNFFDLVETLAGFHIFLPVVQPALLHLLFHTIHRSHLDDIWISLSLFCLAFTNPNSKEYFFNHSSGKNSQCAIIQLNKLLFVGKRFFYFCYSYLLIAKNNIHLGIKPIGIAADIRYWFAVWLY